MKYQNEFDEKMKRSVAGSSINYRTKWENLLLNLRDVERKHAHNSEPMKEVIEHIRGFYLDCKEKLSGNCLVLNIYGTPGCGKSQAAEDIGRALGASSPVVFSPDNIDKEDKDLSVTKQIRGQWSVGEGEKGYTAYGKLVAAIKYNKHPFVIINDIDKFPKEFISSFWDLADSGRITISGLGQVTLNGAIIILTSNNRLFNEKDAKLDSSQTVKSLQTRIPEILFNTPKKEDYERLLKNVLNSNITWAKKEYDVELECNDDALDSIARRCVEIDSGFRTVVRISRFIKAVVDKKYRELRKSGEKLVPLKFQLKYNENYKSDNDLVICEQVQ